MQLNRIGLSVLTVLVFCGAVFAQTSPLPLFARDALIGKWKATVAADDGGKETTDQITFKGGKFKSDNEAVDGFEEATYDDHPSPVGLSAKFSVTLTNKAGDTAKWEGFSTGNEMTGTLVVTKKDGTTTNYSFKAARS